MLKCSFLFLQQDKAFFLSEKKKGEKMENKHKQTIFYDVLCLLHSLAVLIVLFLSRIHCALGCLFKLSACLQIRRVFG